MDVLSYVPTLFDKSLKPNSHTRVCGMGRDPIISGSGADVSLEYSAISP